MKKKWSPLRNRIENQICEKGDLSRIIYPSIG